MQALRDAAERDACECERLCSALQKQEQQQVQQQQQFAQQLEALELENRDLRTLQVAGAALAIVEHCFHSQVQMNGSTPQRSSHSVALQLQRENEQLQQSLTLLQQEMQRWDLLTCVASPPHPVLLTRPSCCRAGHAGDALERKALSPRRSSLKGLLRKGMAGGKENMSGKDELSETTKQQQLYAQALADVAVAAGVAPVAECGDLRVLCLQVRGWGSGGGSGLRCIMVG